MRSVMAVILVHQHSLTSSHSRTASHTPSTHEENNQRNNTVVEMVGSTFEHWVKVELRAPPALILLTHAGCPNCGKLLEVLRAMGDRREGLAKAGTDVRIAHMNCTLNDPPAWLEVHQYPKLLFSMPGETETQAVKPSDFEQIGKAVRMWKAQRATAEKKMKVEVRAHAEKANEKSREEASLRGEAHRAEL